MVVSSSNANAYGLAGHPAGPAPSAAQARAVAPEREINEQNYLVSLTLGQILDKAIQNNPQNDALVYVDRDFRQTWAEFGQEVDRLACGLMALGVQKGEKVAIWATNVPHWLTFMFATAKIGAILITVNTHYRSAELEYLMKQSEAEYLVLTEGTRNNNFLEDALYKLVPELKVQARGSLKSETLPKLKKVFYLGPEKRRGLYNTPEIMALARLTAASDYLRRQQSLHPDEVVNMQYTSGTTGFPKGVMLTHNNIGTNGYWIGHHQNLSQRDRVCLPVPLFHCFGCVLGVMACVNHASTMVLLDSFQPLLVMTSVQQEKCTALYGVPTMFINVLEHDRFEEFDFSSLRTGIMAGSPCPVKTMNDVINRMNAREITICYGLTEGSPVMTQTRQNDDVRKRAETVGRPMPGIEVRVVDPETGRNLPSGQVGEVVCRGYNVMKGYYNQPEATKEAIDQEGWLHSGDLGLFDSDGYLTITGRWKDMIIRGGENIYPKEIEEYIYQMDGVSDVQVVGVPSKIVGEEVVAFVIPLPEARLVPNEIRAALKKRVSRYKVPRYVVIVDSYPLTASGKVQKYKLREQAARLFPGL